MANPRRKAGSRKSACTKNLKSASWEPTADQMAIYRRWCEGVPQAVIGKELGVNQANICRICKRAEAWLIQRTMDDIRGLKLRQTVRLEKYIEQLEGAWDRSKENAESTTVEEIAVDVGDKDGAKLPGKKTKLQTTGQSGQVAYLEAAMSAMDRIRKIWGADAPIQIEGNFGLRVAGMDRESAREAYFQEQLEKLQATRESQLQPQPN